MPGPPPKLPATRARQNRTATLATIESGPATRPEVDTAGWHPNTIRWWETIWASPLSAEWVQADMPALLRLAALESRFWNAQDTGEAVRAHSEIRMGSMQFGLTPMSRRALQWEVKRVEQATSPTVSPLPQRARDPRLRSLG